MLSPRVSNEFFENFSTWIAVFHEASTLKGGDSFSTKHIFPLSVVFILHLFMKSVRIRIFGFIFCLRSSRRRLHQIPKH